MSPGDTFGYISSKAGRIWTKLGRGMGLGKEWSYEFLARLLQEHQRRGKVPTFFHDEYHAPLWSLSLYWFPQNLPGIHESMFSEPFRREILKNFPSRGRFSPKTDFLVASVSFGVNNSKKYHAAKGTSLSCLLFDSISPIIPIRICCTVVKSNWEHPHFASRDKIISEGVSGVRLRGTIPVYGRVL